MFLKFNVILTISIVMKEQIETSRGVVWIQIALLDYGAKWTVESINQFRGNSTKTDQMRLPRHMEI